MQTINGALAQLARVPDWQSGGHEFDPRTLHKRRNASQYKAKEVSAFVFYIYGNTLQNTLECCFGVRKKVSKKSRRLTFPIFYFYTRRNNNDCIYFIGITIVKFKISFRFFKLTIDINLMTF